MTTEIELLLIRGLPGSGKTTMAKKYAQAGYVHCEADQYFEIDGEYRFDGSRLHDAHNDCIRRAIAAMDAGHSVVVANTFTRLWEMRPYLKAAKKRGINTRILEATGNWPSVHGVPADVIERMRARWEPVDCALAAQTQPTSDVTQPGDWPLTPFDEIDVCAVTEIERLRAEVKDYQENGAAAVRFAPSSAHWSAELRRLFGDNAREGIEVLEQRLQDSQARIERLREALELMVEMVEMNGFGRAYAMDVARSALAKEKGEVT